MKIHMTQVFKPVKLTLMIIIMVIGTVALIAELTENEEIAKAIVVPSLVLLIAISGYSMYKFSLSSNPI